MFFKTFANPQQQSFNNSSNKYQDSQAPTTTTRDETSSTAGMFSYPSSPLFEQPFANRDFYAEQTPLRTRQQPHESDAFFAPSNPYFTAPQRRKRHNPFASSRHQFSPDQWVKQAMRLILLSPLIVLVLWSVGAVFFSNHHHGSNTSRNASLLLQPLKQPKAQKTMAKRPKTIQKFKETEEKAKEVFEEGLLEVVELSGDLLGEAQPPRMAQQPLQQQAPMGQAVQVNPLQLQQQAVPLGATGGGGPPNNNYHGANRYNGGGESRATQWAHQIDHVLHPQPRKELPLSSGPANNLVVQPPNLRGSVQGGGKRQKVVYYYYDPQATSVGPDGQVFLPSVVYDEAGTPLETHQIGSKGAQVFVQPPPLFGSSSSSRATNSNTTDPQGAPQEPIPLPVMGMAQAAAQQPVKGISLPSKADLQGAVQRAEVQYQENGSSVIVMTVAVMALLVGALSARKLRGHRSILSACIENERLDHIVVDSTTMDQTNNTPYSTFHWKGDLEKFDV